MCQNNDQENKMNIKPNCTPHTQANPRTTLTSNELLKGAQELLIEHNGCCYCLRLTKQNKLILTK